MFCFQFQRFKMFGLGMRRRNIDLHVILPIGRSLPAFQDFIESVFIIRIAKVD